MLETLKRNLSDVEGRIQDACRRAGRQREELTLVAVTKYVDADVAKTLLELGVTHLGESRPQELWKKASSIPEAKWHLVGHLQRNKIERTLPIVQLIHSVDSIRLLEALEAEARKRQQPVRVLLEFHLSGEETKSGFAAAESATFLDTLPGLQFVRVEGLMTMAALADNSQKARPTFVALRELRDQMRSRVGPPHDLRHLSMGMTNDFEVAIEEGATLVRIGSALFRGLEGVA